MLSLSWFRSGEDFPHTSEGAGELRPAVTEEGVLGPAPVCTRAVWPLPWDSVTGAQEGVGSLQLGSRMDRTGPPKLASGTSTLGVAG